jgi:hypothetical protein
MPRWAALLFLIGVAPLFSTEQSRAVVSIYSSSQPSAAHLAAELPLHYLGCTVNYHDLAYGLPSDEVAAGTLAIISWPDLSDSTAARTYCQWLVNQVRRGTRLVMIGQVPASLQMAELPQSIIHWPTDLFLFFEEALDLKDTPRLDTTTLFGHRLFFNHIHEQGANDPTEMAEYRTAGEAILSEIVDRFSLPTSISLEVSPRRNVEFLPRGAVQPVNGKPQIEFIEAYRQTELPANAAPRRVTPMGLIYRLGNGRTEEEIYTLRFIYEYVLHQEPIPIFTTHYLRVVEDFATAKIEQIADGGWRFENYGRCQTVRFDHERRWPDLDRSVGLLGYKRWEDSLYIHLARASSATLYLTEQEATRPFLVDSTAEILHFAIEDGRLSLILFSVNEAQLRFANLPPDRDYRVLTREMGGDLSSKSITTKSDRNGHLQINLPIHGTTILDVELLPAAP